MQTVFESTSVYDVSVQSDIGILKLIAVEERKTIKFRL